MSNYDQLYGKALQTLVTNALSSLNSEKKTVTITEIQEKILSDRPRLIIYLKTHQDKRKLRIRITNCVKQLAKSELISIQKKTIDKIKTSYYIVDTEIQK